MKSSIARALGSAAMAVGLSLALVIPSSADPITPAKPTDHVVEFKSTKDSFEAALDAYKKAAGSTKAAKASKEALKEVARGAQKKAETERLAALEQVFANYTDALNRAATNYAAAVVAAKKDAAAKNVAKNLQTAAITAATSAYNLAKADLKPLAKVT